VPIATTAEQRAAADSVRAWSQRAGTVSIVRAQEREPTRWRDTWADFAELGAFGLALPESHGGLGGSAVDLAAILEEATRSLVPGPVLGTALTALMVAWTEGAERLAEEVASLAIGVVVEPVPAHRAAGRLVLSGGPFRAVCAEGADALLVLARDGDDLVYTVVAVAAPGVKVAGRGSADLTRPMAEASFDSTMVEPDRILHGLDVDTAGDIAITLAAAEAAGVAAWALQTATDYAKIREQFGKPIGTFQAVKHRCAEMVSRAYVARAQLNMAAVLADRDVAGNGDLEVASALLLALDAGQRNSEDNIQNHGGIGVTAEHPAGVFVKRAQVYRHLAGRKSELNQIALNDPESGAA
jgi:hypothetical protein